MPYRIPCPPAPRRRERRMPILDVLLSPVPVFYALIFAMLASAEAWIWGCWPVPWPLRAILGAYPGFALVPPTIWLWQWWRDEARALLEWRAL